MEGIVLKLNEKEYHLKDVDDDTLDVLVTDDKVYLRLKRKFKMRDINYFEYNKTLVQFLFDGRNIRNSYEYFMTKNIYLKYQKLNGEIKEFKTKLHQVDKNYVVLVAYIK